MKHEMFKLADSLYSLQLNLNALYALLDLIDHEYFEQPAKEFVSAITADNWEIAQLNMYTFSHLLFEARNQCRELAEEASRLHTQM